MRDRAFSLVELLVVISIIAVLAGLLFPVLTAAKSRAKTSACASNLGQLTLATQVYVADFDDRLFPSQYRSDLDLTPPYDRRWPQVLVPYVKNFRVFRCPSDSYVHPEAGMNDPAAGMQSTDQILYRWAERTNYGYNSLYLSPAFRSGNEWISSPVSTTDISNPSATLLFVETAWTSNRNHGAGGGRYFALPPCRFMVSNGTTVDTIGSVPPIYTAGTPFPGWSLDQQDEKLQFGGVFAWHGEGQNQAMLDGSVKWRSIRQTSAGCDVRPKWQGSILNLGEYLWDAN